MPDGYELDTDPERIDGDVVWAFLSTEAYWRPGRTREEVDAEVAAAWRVLGLYGPDGTMAGFAKVTRQADGFAYLDDVFVLSAHRGGGLGKRLVREALALAPDRPWRLRTRDAHGLYERFGFVRVDDIVMEKPGGVRS